MHKEIQPYCQVKSKYIITVLLFFLSVYNLHAQTVYGVVSDASTGEPLPAVHVYYLTDQRTVVQTDVNGNYRIPFRKGTLVFSMMGFHKKAVEMVKPQKLNVRLAESASALGEVRVEVKRRKYTRKNNPAVELMQKVIAGKDSNNIRRHPFLSYRKYEKMTFSLNEFTETVFQDDKFKHFPYLKEHVEVHPETGKLILPLTVDEKISMNYFRQEPHSEKTHILGQRSEGITKLINTGDIFTGLLFDCFTDVDIYQNQVRLLQYPFTSPISSSGAINFYRYFIADTLSLNDEECYKIEFTPNNPQDFGFSGSLFITADSTWRVRRAEIGIPSRSDVNFVEHMYIVQEFRTLPGGEQALSRNSMRIQLKLTDHLQKFQVERIADYSKWDFSPIDGHIFRQRADVTTDPSAQMRSEAFWQENRTTPLSKTENSIGGFISELHRTKGMKPFLWIAKAFIENYVETSVNPERPSKIDIGPINTMVGSNFVEGFRLRANAQTTAHFNPHWFLRGNVKYGFGDKRWKGLAEVTYSFNRKEYMPHEFPQRTLSLSYENDVSSPSDKFLSTDKDNVFVSFKWSPVRHMNYFERFNLLYTWEWQNGLRLTSCLRREWNEGAGDLFYQHMNGSPIPHSDASANLQRIVFSEAMVGLTYQPGASYVNTKKHRLTTNFDTPIMSLSHTTGLKGVLGGQYDYNFTEASLYKRFWLRSWGKMDFMLKGGVQWNKVPYPFLIMPAANLSYIMEEHTFSLIHNMEFPTDRYASLMMDWDMNGKILNRIPLIRRLKWRESIGINCLWGMLTDRNNPFLSANRTDPMLFYFPGYFQAGGTFCYASRVMNPRKPYVEVVAGLHNIFKFFHIQYVHRLNYRYPGQQRWGIRGTLRMTF